VGFDSAVSTSEVHCEHVFVDSEDRAVAGLLDQGVSRAEISRRLGVDHRKVSAIAKRLGYPPKQRRRTRYDWPAIRAYYEAGHSRAEARLRFAITEGAWGSAVRRGDLVLRGGSRDPSATRAAVREMLEEGLSQAAIARELEVSPATVAHHARALGVVPDRRFSQRYDWAAVQRAHDEGLSPAQCAERFGFAKCTWHAAVRRGDLIARPSTIPLEELLVRGRPQTSRGHLKQRLLAAGVKQNRCEQCGISEWQGRPISLQLHHKDGDGTNNELENLEILCPNCHSLTDTWGGRNGRRRRKAA
jgi:hypothetical protein